MNADRTEDWVVLHPDDVTTLLGEDGQVLGYRIATSLLQAECILERFADCDEARRAMALIRSLRAMLADEARDAA